jgi:pimeloyl-ACP methyl ester carboxylesterase
VDLTVSPSDTSIPGSTYGPIGDPAKKWSPNNGHIVHRPPWLCPTTTACNPKDLLVVFLPGCGGKPDGYQDFLTTAGSEGYHVIGLDYPNPCEAVFTSDAEFESYWREVALAELGNNAVPLEGHPQDAILPRLKALLNYMLDHDPNGRWDRFMEADAAAPDGLRMRWDRIMFAGHSMGTAYAAYFAKRFVVKRVILMAGPEDGIETCAATQCCDPLGTPPTSPSWFTQHATPSDRYYGLVHPDDTCCVHRYDRAKANWDTLGMMASHRFESTAACLDSCGETTDDGCKPHYVVTEISHQSHWQTMLDSP